MPLTVCKNARISSQKRKEAVQHVRNTYEQTILKYKMRCRVINSHKHIINGKRIKSLTTFRTIYRTVKMVSYDVTELITSKHIRSTKRVTFSCSNMCQRVCVDTRQNTAKSETKSSRLRLKYEKKGSDQKQVD